jgi:hypothetical protein
MSGKQDLSIYLEPTYFIDSNSPTIIGYETTTCHGKDTDIDRAIALYYGVRDDARPVGDHRCDQGEPQNIPADEQLCHILHCRDAERASYSFIRN